MNAFTKYLIQILLCLSLSGCSFISRMAPFHRAIWYGDLAKTQVLLANGADLFTTDTTTGLSSIELAIDSGRIEMVKLLIESVPDVNSFEGQGVSPLSRAALRENVEICKYLINKGVHVNTSIKGDVPGWTIPLVQAAEVGNLEIIELLVRNGADVNANEGIGITPLHVAVIKSYPWTLKKNDIEIAKLLIKHGARINIRSYDGRTPLHEVVLHGRKEVAEFLIRSGADVNAKDNAGSTPLDWAVVNGFEMIKLLREHGAVDTNPQIISNHKNEHQ